MKRNSVIKGIHFRLIGKQYYKINLLPAHIHYINDKNDREDILYFAAKYHYVRFIQTTMSRVDMKKNKGTNEIKVVYIANKNQTFNSSLIKIYFGYVML